MATVIEKFAGRTEIFSGDANRAEIPYLVTEAIDEVDVKAALDGAVAAAYAGMELLYIEITERVNETTWNAVAYYGAEGTGTSAYEEASVSFDTGGGVQHITQSINTVSLYGPKATPAFGGAIGFDGETVQGVDITVPVYNFTETHILQDQVVTPAYRQKIFGLTGKVNKYGFRTFAAGEVLFMGANGSKRGSGDWEVSFRFAAMANRTGIQVGSISGIAKKGWDYMWVQYDDDSDATTGQVVKVPVAVYIEQVYEVESFGLLGIGR